MVNYLVRFGKRFAVLVPGLIITYVAIREIYPQIDRRGIPEAVAILATYILIAYIMIPAAMRLLRVVFKPQHIPLYCTTPDGFASDPVNIGVVGTREDLIYAMTAAGWSVADRMTLRNLTKMALAILLNRSYPSAPCSQLYFFGRSQDIAFEKSLANNPRRRHHVRFWAASYTTDPQYRSHLRFWQRHHTDQSSSQLLWVGAASLDSGIRPILHTGQISHMIHPDTNAERELIVQQLEAAGVLKEAQRVKAGKPYRLRNRVIGGYLVADGDLTICHLKSA